jgi:pyruvate formate lyase activating enzyme
LKVSVFKGVGVRIGGIQKNSLIDYPGKISCVVFVSGCNFKCPYCHNPELVRNPENRHSEFEIFKFLEQRKHWLDAVVVSGGEPTLQEDIGAFCKKVKSMGYPVKLDTNGSRPEVIGDLLKQKLVDYIAMDIKTVPHQYFPVISNECKQEEILCSIEIIMAAGIEYEFKTTCVKPLIDTSVMDQIARLISGAKRYAIQRFQDKTVLQPEFFMKNDCRFSEEEFLELKSIAEKRVLTCITR